MMDERLLDVGRDRMPGFGGRLGGAGAVALSMFPGPFRQECPPQSEEAPAFRTALVVGEVTEVTGVGEAAEAAEVRDVPHRDVRMEPRISVNKLGEYLVTSPSRRRSILQNQKYPNAYVYRRYERARLAIREYLLSGAGHPDGLYDTLEHLANLEHRSGSEYERRDLALSGRAIGHFLELVDLLPKEDLERVPGEAQPPRLWVGPVSVSVRPDVIVRRRLGKGTRLVGAIKVHFSKDHPITDDAARYVACLTHRYLEEHVAGRGEKASLAHCLLVDVFSRTITRAPASYRRRRTDIEAACAEIAAVWPRL